jgi:cytochrome P450
MGEVAATMPPNTHPQAYLTAIAQKYNLKGIFYIDLWPIATPQVVLTDPELMSRVTINKPLQIHQIADDFISPIVGHNVIAVANGSIWKKAHNAMAPAFSKSHIRSLTDVIVEETMQFRGALDRHAAKEDVFSMEDTAARLIFDVIGRILFNIKLHAQTEGSALLDDLRAMIHLVQSQLSYNPFVKIGAAFKRWKVLGRLNPTIVGIIKGRLSILRDQKIVPSRKDPYSILDLMLREHTLDEDKMKEKPEDLTPEFLELLVTK